MKIISWNVNGVRSIIKKGFVDFVAEHDPDVICLQETKAHPDQVELDLPGYHQHWSWAERKGYSGTAVLCKEKPVSVLRGLRGRTYKDTEGRVATVELDSIVVVSVYVPNSKRDLSRLDDRLLWDKAFRNHCKAFARDKPVVFCGDLNVAHTEIDLARPKQNRKTHGFTIEERESFGKLLAAGFVDTFRQVHGDIPDQYTWWRQFGGAREKNIGWRIDYVCASESLVPHLRDAFILKDVLGSDHCPVGIVLDLPS